MSDTPSSIKAKVKRDFLKGDTMVEIAKRYGISTKSVQRWANEGGWREQRTVMPMERRYQEYEQNQNKDAEPQRPRRKASINELEIVDLALSDISGVMGTGELDPRVMGGLASGLCRLIELRLKLKPRTAAEVADLAIDLGMKPHEFIAELRNRWQQEA